MTDHTKILRRLLTGTALMAGLGLVAAPMDAAACSADSPYMASICYMTTDYCPEGYLPADGRSLSVNQYQAIYALIGNIYGGNSTQFNLPNLNGRSVIGTGAFPGQTPNFVRGNTGGNASVTTS